MSENCTVVAIGLAYGEPDPLVSLLRQWPAPGPMAGVLVPSAHPDAAILGALTRAVSAPVRAMRPGESVPIEAGKLYLTPPHTSAAIQRGVLKVTPPAEELGRAMPIDSLFRSVAAGQGSRAVGVLLPGTLPDGAAGLRAIELAGGLAFATQRKAVACPDSVLTPDGIGRQIARLARLVPPAPQELKEIVLLLSLHTGVDFSSYRREFLESRVLRRMLASGQERAERYLRALQKRALEVQALYESLLVPMSGFPGPEVLDTLRSTVFPRLLAKRPPGLPVRAWVPGCGSGEEAYSVALCLLEALEEAGAAAPIEVFGTDLNPAQIAYARAATYPEAIRSEIAPERLRRFFRKVEDGFRLNKAARDACFFTRHDLTADEPFSELDLISCRHVLTYVEPAALPDIFSIFHGALRPGGFLLVEPAEHLSVPGDLFQPERTGGLYRRACAERIETPGAPRNQLAAPSGDKLDLCRQVDRILLAEYTPPGAVVDAESTVIEFRGALGPYLEQSPAVKPDKLVPLLRSELQAPVRAALREAAGSGEEVSKRGLQAGLEGGSREIDLRVVPVGAGAGREHFLILFEEGRPRPPRRPVPAASHAPPGDSEEDGLAELRRELLLASERLSAAVEEHQAARQAASSVGAELRRLLAVFHSLDPLVLLGSDLSIERLTGTAARFLGLTPAACGRSLAEACADFDGPDLTALAGSALSGNRVRCEPFQANGRSYVAVARPRRNGAGPADGVLLTFVQIG